MLAAGCGALALVHRDLQAIAEEIVSHSHLNPASRFPRIFLDVAGRTTDARLWALAGMAAAYAAVRLAEAYGLWRARRWAEWLGAASGAIYVPIETYEIARRFTATRLVLLAGNLLIVVYLLGQLRAGPAAPQTSSSPGKK